MRTGTEAPFLDVRALLPRDAALFAQLYGDARVMRHIGAVLTAAEAKTAFAATFNAQTRQPQRRWDWVGVADGCPVGLFGLKIEKTDVGRHLESGIVLRSDAQGRGHATQGLQWLLRTAFLQLDADSVSACHACGNERAAATLRSAGFVLDGEIQGRQRWRMTARTWAIAGQPKHETDEALVARRQVA